MYSTLIINVILRYTLIISFKDKRIKDLIQSFKTLKETLPYKTLIDDTVNKAVVIDNVNNKVALTFC